MITFIISCWLEYKRIKNQQLYLSALYYNFKYGGDLAVIKGE